MSSLDNGLSRVDAGGAMAHSPCRHPSAIASRGMSAPGHKLNSLADSVPADSHRSAEAIPPEMRTYRRVHHAQTD